MVRHIVMFRFKQDVSQDIRLSAQDAFKRGIEALPAVIPFVQSVHVGFNINPAEQWDICLDARFNKLEEVNAYSTHPAHKAIAQQLMKHIEQRACVDWQE